MCRYMAAKVNDQQACSRARCRGVRLENEIMKKNEEL